MSSYTNSSRGKKKGEESKSDRPQSEGNSCIKAEAQLQQGRSEAIVQRPREHEPDCQLDDCSGDGVCERRADSSRGWKVGDRVSYKSSNGYARTGVIAEIINDGALVDEGHPYKSWIEFKYLEPCLQCLTSLPELEGQQLPETVLASKQPDSLKSTPMPHLSSSIASPTSQSTTTSKLIALNQESMTSIGCHSPALEPAAPDCEPDLTTQNQLCGLKHCGVLQMGSPASSSSKILQGLSAEDYEQFLEDSEWSAIVGTIHKSYQLRNWERRRRGKDFSLLPTPTTYAKGSGKYRPAGATKLEQSLRQFINLGDKLHPAVPGWMMGFPPGWAELVLMDGGIDTQLPFIAECAAIPPSAENATISTPEVSFQSKLQSPSVEFCTCPNCEEPLIELEDLCAVGGWVNLPCASSAKTISSTPGSAKKVLEENKIYSLERFDKETERHSREKVLEEKRSYSLEKSQRKKAPKQTTSHIQVTSTSSGSLYRYLKNIKLKSGEIASYPKVQLVRDPDNLEHWYWGYNYKVLEDGEWRSKSLSVPRVLVRAVQRMIENHAPVAAIKAALKLEHREPATVEKISTSTEPPCLEKVLEDSSTDSLERNQLIAKPDCLEKVLGNNPTDSLEKFPASGSLYRYLKNKKLKSGAIASYPRVKGVRNPNNPDHWYWGYSYEVLEDEEWKGRSLSVPKRKVLAVQAMIDSHKSVAAIKVFIRSN